MGIAGGLWRVETRVNLSLSRRGRGTFIPPRRRAFCPDGSPSCALFGRREAAVLAMLSEAVRSTRRRFPRSCTPLTFSASPSARPSVGCVNRGRLRHGYMRSFQPLRGGSPDRTAPGIEVTGALVCARLQPPSNSHCTPTALFLDSCAVDGHSGRTSF